MNIMNDKTRIDYAARRAAHSWFLRSLAMLGVLWTSAAIISVQQYWEYQQVMQEHSLLKAASMQLHACLEHKRTLKEQHATLQKELSQINRVMHTPKNPAAHLTVLSSLGANVLLQDITVRKKKVDLVLSGSDSKEILSFADRLRAHALFDRVDVVSFEQAGQRVTSVLHCILK